MPVTRLFKTLCLATIVCLSACGGDSDQLRNAEGTMISAAALQAHELLTGDCYNVPELDLEIQNRDEAEPDIIPRYETVDALPCSEPHGNEVYFVGELVEGDYLGLETVRDEALSVCKTQFVLFVGTDHAVSSLDIDQLVPSKQSWDKGRRTHSCAVYDPTGPLTDTVFQTRR